MLLLLCSIRTLHGTYLENVFLSVNDGETSTVINKSDIARGKPAFRVHSVSGILLILEITLKDSGSSDVDLTTRVGLVRDKVVHLWDIHKLDLAAGTRTTNMARNILAKRSM